ncbi:hypothetical protein CYMTET_50003 [Cymbomonas tetramitiformis]|uniref:Ankyrin repeat protein n=1 Tax=Cymbomonas tetramitiformis TaxID=36881 RepID=A0AAE0BR15_9CHLO|nr:hypothetical protein CYMTET_50003 [Cymbomonas tetramitiformis]
MVARGMQAHVGAAGGGHLEVLQWAREHGCPRDARTCAFAAGGGHLEVLQWAREHGCPWDASTCHGAAGGGHLEVLQWAREHGCPRDARTLGGHLENCCSGALSMAARGTPAHVRWRRDDIRRGVLQRAREHGCPCVGRLNDAILLRQWVGIWECCSDGRVSMAAARGWGVKS